MPTEAAFLCLGTRLLGGLGLGGLHLVLTLFWAVSLESERDCFGGGFVDFVSVVLGTNVDCDC